MAKVQFKRYETDLEAQESDVIDGQFIVTKDGTSYIDYGEDRVAFGGTPDTQMSDTSQNAVQNKVIKEYVDDSFKENNVYSTTETVIGKWVDGKPVYRKVIDFGSLPNTTTKSVNHNISIDLPIKCTGIAYKSDSAFVIPWGGVSITLDKAKISIDTATDRTNYSARVICEYTKTTD